MTGEISKIVDYATGIKECVVPAEQYKNIDVQFGRSFSVIPKVFVSIESALIPGVDIEFPIVTVVDDHSFNLRLKNNHTEQLTIPVAWFAIY